MDIGSVDLPDDLFEDDEDDKLIADLQQEVADLRAKLAAAESNNESQLNSSSGAKPQGDDNAEAIPLRAYAGSLKNLGAFEAEMESFITLVGQREAMLNTTIFKLRKIATRRKLLIEQLEEELDVVVPQLEEAKEAVMHKIKRAQTRHTELLEGREAMKFDYEQQLAVEAAKISELQEQLAEAKSGAKGDEAVIPEGSKKKVGHARKGGSRLSITALSPDEKTLREQNGDLKDQVSVMSGQLADFEQNHRLNNKSLKEIEDQLAKLLLLRKPKKEQTDSDQKKEQTDSDQH